jgi:hypothetical protein
MRKIIGVLITVFALMAIATTARAESPARITVARAGVPAPNVAIDIQILNRGKVPLGTTGATGDLEIALGMANLGKATRVQVVMYDCPNDRTFVVLVEVGAVAPEDQDCRRRIAGWFWFGRARTVLVDLTAGVITVGGQGFLGTTRGRAILVGAAGVAAIGVVASGGSTTPQTNTPPANNPGTGNPPTNPGPSIDPAGPYNVVNTVSSDPGNHRNAVNMEPTTVLTITFDSNNVARIVCPPGSKYTALTGPAVLNSATGEKTITAEGRATVAGVSNVLYRIVVTILTTGANAGRLSGQLTVGANGELPGGQGIVFSVTGQKG